MTRKSTKTDNGNLPAKLKLRRFFLSRFHASAPPVVIDACQGSGTIWSQLRKEFEIARIWGLDKKRRAGRLRADSGAVLSRPGWVADVVDVDTYGHPWRHWMGILENAPGPLTVFLTIGTVSTGGGVGIPDELRRASMPFERLRVPPSLGRCVIEAGIQGMLSRAHHRFDVAAAKECAGGNARYIGIRLDSKTS